MAAKGIGTVRNLFSGRFAWELWLYGLISGIISGGAGSVLAAFGAMGLSPNEFNPATGKFYALLGITFMGGGILAGLNYLHQQALPPLVTTTTTESIGVPGQPPALVSRTVEQVEVSENSPPDKLT